MLKVNNVLLFVIAVQTVNKLCKSNTKSVLSWMDYELRNTVAMVDPHL